VERPFGKGAAVSLQLDELMQLGLDAGRGAEEQP
jgi:hypothetical protein